MQGSLKTLVLVKQILDKIQVKPEDAQSDDIIDIDFTGEEFELLSKMIHLLDQSQKLNLDSLSLVQKILNK
jgi:hypothetical protein